MYSIIAFNYSNTVYLYYTNKDTNYKHLQTIGKTYQK